MKILSKSIIRSILLILITYHAIAQPFDPPLSNRIASYDIQVGLNPDTKILNGKERLVWINPSEDTIYTLQFHLYLNAFKNTLTTFMKESGGQHRGIMVNLNDSINFGWVRINSIRPDNGQDLSECINYISPDDDNIHDQTVMEIMLKEPVMPHDTLILDIDFTSKLPKISARTGFGKNYFLAGQWFPKIGVYEIPGQRFAEEGQWNCHQFHYNSEFYADYGVYNVEITVPDEYIVGASGWLVSEKDHPDSTKTLTYRAEDVIDFVWTASPDYIVVKDQWEHVSITLLNQPEHSASTERYITSVKQGLEYFHNNLGKYPYKTLTVVDAPLHAVGANGMEYPNFITAGTTYLMPEGVLAPESVTIHEFGHQYFMLLLATNEFEEPLLDEGFNTYYEHRAMDFYYGEKSSMIDLWGYQIGDGEMARIAYTRMNHPKIGNNSYASWEFKHGGYGTITYQKAATWMKTLERLVGTEVMDEIMKTYFERWKFKHPCTTDFIDIVNEIVPKYHAERLGTDMNWFFEQVLYGDDICDYKVAYLENIRRSEPKGILEYLWEKNDENDSLKIYDSKVILHRMGEIILPVEVLIHFNDGSEELEWWNGRERSYEFTYTGPRKIVWASIDPHKKVYMDVNFINNSRTLEPERAVIWKYTCKLLFWIQNIMQSFVLFI